jgi:FAD/FMN-containing dehydrogenase
MESRAMTIRLELELAPDSLTGRALPDRGSERKFSGWLGLVAAIDALLAHPDMDLGASMTETLTTLALVRPGDADYDDVRHAFNLAVDQRPAAVALPTSASDVAAAIAHARSHGLTVIGQATGHSAPRFPLDQTLLLKTERMTGVTIDPIARTARVEAGALWQDVTEKAAEHGLVALAGSSPNVGVAGYVLGGGLSWLGRSKGLASNNVQAIEVVLADGRQIRTDATTEPDLFWALRGGGGSFAIATAFEIDLFPMTDVYAGMFAFPWERAAEVLDAWRRWAADAPDEITTSARIVQVPPAPEIPEPLRGRGLVVIDGAYDGNPAEGAVVLEPLRALGPELDGFAAMPAAALSTIHMDPPQPVPAMSDTLMVSDLDADGIDALVAVAGAESGSPLVAVELRQLGGALARIPEGAGALDALGADFLLFAVGVPMDEASAAAAAAQLEKVKDALSPYDAGCDYLNFVDGDVDPERLFSEDAYRRLQAVKAQYDPQDVFVSGTTTPQTQLK